MKQEIDEAIIKYLYCLRNASRYCEFEKLRQGEQTIEEDLIQLSLLEVMYNASHWYKIMEQLQIGNVFKYLHWLYTATRINTESQPSEQMFADTYMLKKIFKMFVLWTWTWNKKRKMPSNMGKLYKLF